MSAAAVLDEYLDGLLAPAPDPAAAPAPAIAAVAAAAPVASPAMTAARPPMPAPPSGPLATATPSRPAYPPADMPEAPSLPPRTAASFAGAGDDGAASPHQRRAAERSSRWLRLRCGRQDYGLELLKVQEVLLPVPLLPLRGTPPAMLGVMNLRGQVVPVMDLCLHLGQSTQADTAATRIVVLEEKGDTLGLRVSAVEDVVTLAEPQIERPGKTRGRIHSDLFRGIARQSAEPVVLLDASRLLFPEGAHGTAD